jgi:hypothetical protein
MVIDKIKDGAMNTLGTLCARVSTNFYDKIAKPSAKQILTQIDPTGIANAVQTCKDKNKSDRMCAKAVMESTSNFDPTGVVGLAAAFIHDKCNPLPKVIKCFENSIG